MKKELLIILLGLLSLNINATTFYTVYKIDIINNGRITQQHTFNAIDAEYRIIEYDNSDLVLNNTSCFRINNSFRIVRINDVLFIKNDYNILNGKDKYKGTIYKRGEHNILFSAMGHPFQQLAEMILRSSVTSGSSLV